MTCIKRNQKASRLISHLLISVMLTKSLEAVARHSRLVLKHLLRAHQISWSQKSDSGSPRAHHLCACLPGGSGGMPDMCPGTGGGCEPTLKAPEVDTRKCRCQHGRNMAYHFCALLKQGARPAPCALAMPGICMLGMPGTICQGPPGL